MNRSGGILLFVSILLYFCAFANAQNWTENFDKLANQTDLLSISGWSGFAGLPVDYKPKAVVVDGEGFGDSKALAISCFNSFRGYNYGVVFRLPKPYKEGVVWVQCKIKPPVEWKAGFFLDALGSKRHPILGRVAASPYDNRLTKTSDLRRHCSWQEPN